MGPSGPVVLVEGVLDRDNVVTLGDVNVDGGELLSGEPLGGVGLGVLEAGGKRAEIRIARQRARRPKGKKAYSRSYLPSL